MMQKSFPRAVLGFALIALLMPSSVQAQWSSSALAGLAVAGKPGEQTQPKIKPAPDGGCYVSWFDNDPTGSPPGGYDVYLQRLDPDGNPLWAPGGVLIADRGFSSTQDYGFDVDAQGNALLAFRDDRSGGTLITATKVDPWGTQLWGSMGVQFGSPTAFLAAPEIAGTSDGYVVVAWTQDSDVVVQKIDPLGNPWAAVMLSEGGAANYSVSGLVGSDNGSVIVCWVREVGFPSPRHLYANKISSNGQLLWGASHVAILDSGSLQFGNFPGCISDGGGGAVFGWYTNSPSLQCWAQHVLANGTEAFPHNGAAGSTNASQLRVNPDVAFDPQSGETYLFWDETNTSQSQHGISGQKFDAVGSRLWTSNGITVTPLGPNAIIGVRTLATTSGAQVAWIEQQGTGNVVRAARYDASGATLCAPFAVSSASGSKGRLAGSLSTVGVAHYAWRDDRNDAGDLYAQNVNPDCTLGGVYSGTGDDFLMISGTNGLLSAADVKLVQPGDILTVSVSSPAGSFGMLPPLLVGQIFTTGAPPTVPGFPAIHVDPLAVQPLLVLYDGWATPFGTTGLPLTLSYLVPAGLSGQSLMLQAYSPGGAIALNGQYGLTDGNEIRFVP